MEQGVLEGKLELERAGSMENTYNSNSNSNSKDEGYVWLCVYWKIFHFLGQTDPLAIFCCPVEIPYIPRIRIDRGFTSSKTNHQ